jgi:uncharacterized membrane protein
MNLQYMLKPEEFLEVSFIRQFALSFILISLVPIALLVYLIYGFNLNAYIENQIPYFRITITLVVLLSLAGYDLIRRNMVALYFFLKKAQELLQDRTDQDIHIRSTGDIKRTIKLFDELLVKQRSGAGAGQ